MSPSTNWERTSKGAVISIAPSGDKMYGVGLQHDVFDQSLSSMSTSTDWEFTGSDTSSAVKEPIVYSWAGCYQDNQARDLSTTLSVNGHSTVAQCQQLAASRNFKYFALQAKGWCLADNSFATPTATYKPVPISQCGTKCENEIASGTTLLCGSDWINAVYVTKPEPVSTTSPYTWAGSFFDNAQRDLKKGPQQYGFTVATCQQWALSRNFRYFALQHNGWCAADNNYASSGAYKYVKPSMSTGTCTGETATGKNLYCGGNWVNSVYVTKGLQEVTTDGFAGCFWDNSARDLKNFAPRENSYTVATCRQYAISRGMPYFGLQAGGECRTGTKWNEVYGSSVYSNVADDKCGNKCADETADDKVLKCGSGWVNAIYFAEPMQRATSPGKVAGGVTPEPVIYTNGQNDDWCKSVGTSQGWEYAYNGGKNIPPTAGTAWCTRKQLKANNVEFVGCFNDNSERDLKTNIPGSSFTIATCSQWAISRSFKYFALQANGECRGANQHGGKAPYGPHDRSECGGPCSGETMQVPGASYCGTGWVNAIYLTLPPVSTPAPQTQASQTQAPLLKSSMQSSPATAAPTPAGCRSTTVLQKVNGAVNLTQIQLCGGENATCYIMNKCREPTTTITTTTITITTSTTTTIVYECHCKVFAENQGPGCSGKCCILSSNNTGGEGFDSDCMTQKNEQSCNTRTNGANENFCTYKSRAHWRTMEMR